MRRLVVSFACLALLCAVAAPSGGPAPRNRRPLDPPDLQKITERSGLIFLGRVESIGAEPRGDRVRITFRVLDGIRGARTGEVVTVEEWRGLWVAGHDRYQPGETLMLFFYPRSRLGLTSPVGGEAGRLEITPTQHVVLSPDRVEALPRSLRLQKGRAGMEAAPHYQEFAKAVRELAGAAQP